MKKTIIIAQIMILLLFLAKIAVVGAIMKKPESIPMAPTAEKRLQVDHVTQVAANTSNNTSSEDALSKPRDLLMALESKRLELDKREQFLKSEEKRLIKYISTVVERLEERYADIYLLRNEKDVKLYRFSDGKATEPDFLFFLSEKTTGRKMLYQLFIESKGEHLLEHDKWKEDFLLSIEGEAAVEHIHEDADVKIIGLPFYTSAAGHQPDFRATFREKLGLV